MAQLVEIIKMQLVNIGYPNSYFIADGTANTGRLLFGETPEFSSILVDQSKILSFDLTPTKSRCQSRKFSFGRKEKNSSSQILRHNILRKSLFLATRRRVYGNWTLLEKWLLSGEEIFLGI